MGHVGKRKRIRSAAGGFWVLAAFLFVRVSSASAQSIPPTYTTIPDEAGANDTASQTDLSQFGSDPTDGGVFRYFWSFDSTDDWTGTGVTASACALFDSD